MTYKELQNLDYHPDLPVEYVLTDLLYHGKIDVNTILSSYTKAIEMERALSKTKFEEACINIFLMLNRKKDKTDEHVEDDKRAIHILNLSDSIKHGTYNECFGYTEQDKDMWDKFTESIYGMKLDEKK